MDRRHILKSACLGSAVLALPDSLCAFQQTLGEARGVGGQGQLGVRTFAGFSAISRTLRPVVRGTRAVVAAGSPFATEAGLRLLHQGGTAVDAGVAATFAAAIVEFSDYGFGGEVPVLLRTREGQVVVIAGMGTAPKLATADWYRARQPDPKNPSVKSGIPSSGILSAMVPGMVDGMVLTLRDYGTRSFAEVIQPALDLANGFPLDECRSSYIDHYQSTLVQWPEAAAVFLPGGHAPKPGEIFRQRNLAGTLQGMLEAERAALAAGKSRTAALDAVRDYFYRGPVAREIDRFSRTNDGLLRYEDLAGFRAEIEAPTRTEYRGLEVYKAGFWTQGPVMLQTLNILEGLDLKNMGHNSADYIHTLIESLKLAFADRDSFYGDPKFVRIPAGTLLSREYAAERRKLLDPARASRQARPGSPDGLRALHPASFPGGAMPGAPAGDTTSVVTADSSGVVFVATPSGGYMPTIIAGSTGILLTQRLQSFLLIPGHPNELQPGKRPRITLTPTLVLRGGEPYLALSTGGGDNQDQTLLQILLNVVEFGMHPQLAIEAPRVRTGHLVNSFENHAFHPGLVYLDERLDTGVRRALEARGHEVQVRSVWESGAAPVAVRYLAEDGVWEAGADPYGHRYAAAW